MPELFSSRLTKDKTILQTLSKKEGIYQKYHSLQKEVSNPSSFEDQKEIKKLGRQLKDIEPIVKLFQSVDEIENQMEENIKMRLIEKDVDILSLINEEIDTLYNKGQQLLEEIKYALLPKDPDDQKNIILEIRAGTGGQEAALFVVDMLRMYNKYAEKNKFKINVIECNMTENKGIKEVITEIIGENVYSLFKHETGTHRVQRIPTTESNGRIHTSAITVAVLPEVEESEIEIKESDLKIDTYRSSGAGGQHVNTTDSAVRITHLPTNTVVTCSDERSQQKNKQKAMKVLRSRIASNIREQESAKRAKERKEQVGSGDRSERIRTYNFPQSRITDHRINKTLHKLEQCLEGDLDELVDALNIFEKEQKIAQNF